jgi:hypothetical protein
MRQARPAPRTFDKAVRWPRLIEPRAEAVRADRHVDGVSDVIVTEHITAADIFRNSGNISHIVLCHRGEVRHVMPGRARSGFVARVAIARTEFPSALLNVLEDDLQHAAVVGNLFFLFAQPDVHR